MKFIIDKLHPIFVIKAFLITFAVVALYVLVVNTIVYLLVPKKNDKRIFQLMKRAFIKTPFIITGYWFLAGLGGYLWGILVVGELFDGNAHVNVSAEKMQPSGSEIVLIIFTLVGFCISVGIGFSAFYKAHKALYSSSSM
jgi:hypothetical protein